MKLPCELIVTHVLPTARGALAKDLVTRHGMTQTQVAKVFGVTSAAVSQYIKGLRGDNPLIDRSAYRDDFYAMISDTADRIVAGADVAESLCGICAFVKETGLLRALYVYEGYSGELSEHCECPRFAAPIVPGGARGASPRTLAHIQRAFSRPFPRTGAPGACARAPLIITAPIFAG